MSKIKFAVIGCGHIGKRHASMIVGNTDMELVALCDIKPQYDLGLEDYKTVPFFESLDELFDSGIEIDIISIATPNGLHEAQALKALDKYHIVVEKPMALTKAGLKNF